MHLENSDDGLAMRPALVRVAGAAAAMMVVVRDVLSATPMVVRHRRCVMPILSAAVIVVMRNVPRRVGMIVRLRIGRIGARCRGQGDCMARRGLRRGETPVGDKLQHEKKDEWATVHEPVTNPSSEYEPTDSMVNDFPQGPGDAA